MVDALLSEAKADCLPLHTVTEADLDAFLERQTPAARAWLTANAFRARAGTVCPLPGANGELSGYAVGVAAAGDIWSLGALPLTLPEGNYRLQANWRAEALHLATLGWALGGYQFSRYRKPERAAARLHSDADMNAVAAEARAVYLVRDLVNTGAEDLMPAQLAEVAADLAERFGADFEQTIGDELLTHGYPAIHAVGRASANAPRLLDLGWGDLDAPRVTLVGKGVCFDSGGLNIKPANGMRLMKKDMGGAAHALGLAHLIMESRLPVRLRVLVPAVENAISGNAYRPGDVIATRKGLTVEVDNTDAEGRIVLCDALAEAVAGKPDVLLDFATLTGAARVALGPDLPALFCNDDTLAEGLRAASVECRDPLWRLPLHDAYRDMLDSRVADLVNSASSPFAGAITAALFLQRFVPDEVPWAHLDLMAWNTRARAGRPEGGEAVGLRAVHAWLRTRFGAS